MKSLTVKSENFIAVSSRWRDMESRKVLTLAMLPDTDGIALQCRPNVLEELAMYFYREAETELSQVTIGELEQGLRKMRDAGFMLAVDAVMTGDPVTDQLDDEIIMTRVRFNIKYRPRTVRFGTLAYLVVKCLSEQGWEEEDGSSQD